MLSSPETLALFEDALESTQEEFEKEGTTFQDRNESVRYIAQLLTITGLATAHPELEVQLFLEFVKKNEHYDESGDWLPAAEALARLFPLTDHEDDERF